LRKYLSEPLLEQLPPLAHLLRYLEQLSLMDPPATKADLILEQVKGHIPSSQCIIIMLS